MPFPYTHVVGLLEALHSQATKKTGPKLPSLKARYTTLITSWFDHHRPLFASASLDTVALFSTLFPELRPDRVYSLREDGLVRVIARCLGLGVTRQRQLGNWRRDAAGDLGTMVERVMRDAENPTPSPGTEITVEEIEAALEELAARSAFSSQGKRTSGRSAHDILVPLFRRMNSTEAKWFTRAILKSYLPLVIPERISMSAYHFMLPILWKFQGDLRIALGVLNENQVFKVFPAKPEMRDMEKLLETVGNLVKPEVGVKVGRVEFLKARSCRNAAVLANRRRISMERKYDGEYCQIHIDLTKGKDWIKIFSKSGRDSTHDRVGIHGAIREALRIIKPDEMGFKKQCIFEGELVVYCEEQKRILEFYHLRSHVTRAGFYLGIAADNRPDFRRQHLMLICYDLLLLDSQSYLCLPYDNRILALTNLIKPRPGYVEFASRFEIDFSKPFALETLREQFASGIAQKWEGFVLKPCDAPYLHSVEAKGTNWIKLKKDYIKGLGDTADFAVVGGCFEPRRGKQRGFSGGGLTTFFAGVLMNKDGVVKFGVRPLYKVVFHVSYCIPKHDLESLNQLAYFKAKAYKNGVTPEAYDLEVAPNLPALDVYFSTPLVFEIMGGGFDRPSDCDYYILRWPRVVKIHWDRDWIDAVGFDELQELAEEAVKMRKDATMDQEDEEERGWVKRLEEQDGGSKRRHKDVDRDDGGRVLITHTTGLAEDGSVFKRRRTERSGNNYEISQSQSQSQEWDSELCTPPRSQEFSLSPPPQQQTQCFHGSNKPNADSPLRGQKPPPLLEKLPHSPPPSSASLLPPPESPNPMPVSSSPPYCPPIPLPRHSPAPCSIQTPQHTSPPRSSNSISQSRHPLLSLSPSSVTNPLPIPITKPTIEALRPCPSPLLDSTIFLMDSVLAQPRLSPLLLLHKPKLVYEWQYLPKFLAGMGPLLEESSDPGVHASNTPSSSRSPPSTVTTSNEKLNERKILILLIDSRTPRTSKNTIEQCVKFRDLYSKSRLEQGGQPAEVVFDCYDWRIVGHSDWKGERRWDWSTSKRDGGGGGHEEGSSARERENTQPEGVAGPGGREEGRKTEGTGEEGVSPARRKRVDWDLFYMVSV